MADSGRAPLIFRMSSLKLLLKVPFSAPQPPGAPRGLDPGAAQKTGATPPCFIPFPRAALPKLFSGPGREGCGGGPPASSPWGSGTPRSPQPGMERDTSVAQVSDAGVGGQIPALSPPSAIRWKSFVFWLVKKKGGECRPCLRRLVGFSETGRGKRLSGCQTHSVSQYTACIVY